MKLQKLIEFDILNDLYSELNNDTISSEVRDCIEDMISTRLEKIYIEARETNRIWKGEGKDQRWKFKKDDGKIVAKTSEEKIKEAFFDYVKDTINQSDAMTIQDLYFAWVDYKDGLVKAGSKKLCENTIARYKRDYKKYIEGTPFADKRITNINAIEVEKFLYSIIKKHNMTSNALENVFGYFNQMFLFGRKMSVIASNPMDLLSKRDIKGFCNNTTKSDEERIFKSEQMNMILEVVHERESEDDSYIQNYAIELATLTGMRVGEIASLAWEKVTDDYLIIDCSEHRIDYLDKPCEYTIGATKNGVVRKFPMTDELRELFGRINKVHLKYGITSEYVFANENGRVNSHTISCAMTRRSEEAGIKNGSIHRIRRTVSSHLRTVLPLATVANLLGHLEETNDKHYNYDILNYEAKLECLDGLYKKMGKVA